MRKHLLVAGLAVSALAGCKRHQAATPTPPDKTPAVAGEIGSRMPDFTLKDLDGHQIPSNNLRSNVVLIDFWATWCKPCEKEMPGYQRLVDRYGSRGFIVIGFKLDTIADSQDPRAFAKKIGVRYPLVVATDDLKAKFGGIEALPTAMIYDRQGFLRSKIVGFEREDVIEATVKPLL
jgi:thiol-disulfide isomerase/thioredoxin